MRELATLWIGGNLGAMERASLASMIRMGHAVSLYSYSPLRDLPQGVVGRDAAEIMSGDKILFYKDKRKPSPSLHSNLFRYALLEKTDAVWVDLDIIALRPLPDDEYLMGFETETSVNSAVLRLPKDSPSLRDLRKFTPETRGVPPHITGARRLKYWIRTLGRGYPIEKWVWGSTGPRALTICLRRHNEIAHARPVETFYRIGVNDHAQFLEPGRWRLSDFGPETICLHLWGSRIRKTLAEDYAGNVPRGSLYDEILTMTARG